MIRVGSVGYPESPEEHALAVAWITEQINQGEIDPANKVALLYFIGDELAAGSYYSNHSPSNVEISLAIVNPRAATKTNIRAGLGYPFYQLGVRRITAVCHIDNVRVRRWLKGVGFMREGKIHDAFEDGHGLLFGMTRRYFLRSKWHEHRQRR